MADSTPVDVILEFLRRNKFTKAEAALRSELGNRPDLNGIIQKLTLDDKGPGNRSSEEVNGSVTAEDDRKINSAQHSGQSLKDSLTSSSAEASKELIVKEVECGTGRNGSDAKWKSCSTTGEQSKVNESVGTSDKNFTFSKGSDDTVLDLYSWKYSTSNGPVTLYQNDGGSANENNFLGFLVPGKARLNPAETVDSGTVDRKSGEDASFSGEKRISWPGNVSNTSVEPRHEKNEHKEVVQQRKPTIMCSKDERVDNPWSRSDVSSHPSSELWKECSVKTVFPFSRGDTSTSYDSAVDKKEGKKKAELNDIRSAIKEQVDEVGRALFFGKTQEGEPKDFGALEFHLPPENQKEELPRLPPVRLKSEDKSFNIHWEEKYERDGPAPKILNADNAYLIGSFLDVPIGQELNPSGKRPGGGSWLSVSQGIAEDTSDLVSGFATIGDGLSESIDYPNEYWDSDEYEDDDDVGYMRQPIEDETWFLAHEIDYPSDNEKGTGHGSVPDPQERGQNKTDEDDQSFAEEDSYFSGEQYFQSKNVDAVLPPDNPVGLSATEMYRRNNETDLIDRYDGQLMDEEELNLMRAEPVWQGFVTQTNELIMLGDGKVMAECGRPHPDDNCMDDDQHGSVRSIGVGINSDAADMGSEVRESLVGGSSEGDIEYFHDNDISIGVSTHSQHDLDKNAVERSKKGTSRTTKHNYDEYMMSNEKGAHTMAKNQMDEGFSFPPPRDGKLVQTSSGKSLWSNHGKTTVSDEADDCEIANGDMLASWKRKSNDSTSVKSSRDENNGNAGESANSSPSSLSNYGYIDREHVKKEESIQTTTVREEDPGVSLEDEEAAAVQEQVKQIKAQEEEFETFELKIVHRKNRTGFEEDKNFHVVLNSVIAGRYHVTEYLGSAAFSKAIQAHDLHTGMDVCVKIIKNNKDFFDQSLDEIKLLKYVNKHDPADKYHILRLYDYFYYREHLLIVCELLKANLYEFHKFNRESGGEVYFTMPRLQSITIQCLEALQFLHSLGLIHCDLKPENILVKSYSRCEVKVIDLGSSCFETDHLCSYVQSRSYRAPEVILGLPYDKKIDIWSLGCILAELCSGNVLFQNDSPATLLARVIGITGPIEQEMLAKGRDTYKYFTKNHMLYERNQDTNRLEYLIPKKSSLRHRLPMGDQGFIDFVAHLLEVNPKKRPTASEALKHPWLQYP
ncbi:Dual-specificity tyrosine-phosphorylation regulated kinase [Handroanthus impetiginosus]|uniref:Dual-specificity tyrosine-phosphorylation regulated kinase n=1 Tax=Handroanthus impetiginosus TaxID=429701 RepID=A0A2G9I724_9LAMI|nr:Dual-specificity tyrosine-phosphorylation regulated kinase [Handroanthus impetiginosus]